MTVGRRKSPNHSKVPNVPSGSEEEEEVDDEVLAAIIRNKPERVARAKGTTIPLMMDPKVILDFINLWYDNPQTPIDDLKLPPRLSYLLTSFINEEKWKMQKAKQAIKGSDSEREFSKEQHYEYNP